MGKASEAMGWIGGRIYEAVCCRELSQAKVTSVRWELDRRGCWLKRERRKPSLEEVDGLVLIEHAGRPPRFLARTTMVSLTSNLRGLGAHLVEKGV